MKTAGTSSPIAFSLFLIAACLGLPHGLQSQIVTNWTAYNEHAPSASTAPNATVYNMRGWVLVSSPTDPGTVYPTSGPLTNFASAGYGPGQKLSATLTISTLLRNPDLFPNAALGYPLPATPAFDVFSPGGVTIADLGNAGSAIGLGNFVGGVGQDNVVLTFTNLNPSMRYKFRGTAVRNGNGVGTHSGRFSLCSIVGAASAVDAATAGVLTSANLPGVPGLALTNGQQVFQSGVNTNGDLVGWDAIDPGTDGSFSIITAGYAGAVKDFYNNMGPGAGPGATFTNAYGAIGYGLAAIRLTEYGPLTAVSVTTQPAPSTMLTEFQPFTLSVKAGGSAPYYQWFKGATPIPGANEESYSVASAVVSDSANYTVVVTNSVNRTTSQVAQVTVSADVIKPTVAGVNAGAGGFFDQVLVQFSERVDLAEAIDGFNYVISGGIQPNSASIVSPGTAESGTVVSLVLGSPLAENTVYQLTVDMIHDLSGNGTDPAVQFSFRTWVLSTAGGVKLELFTGIAGNAVSALTSHPSFPNSPAVVTNLSTFNTREFLSGDSLETYGGRLRALFVPPTSGNWIFYLRSDDSSELYFNPTGVTAAGRILLAAETACCGTFSGHPSAPQALAAGRAYYIEALYKEGGGGDFCQVAAKPAADPTDPNLLTPIPAGMLGFTAPPGVAGEVGITRQPASITTNENQLVTFSVLATNTYNLAMVYQWQTNGVDIIGASGAAFSFVARVADGISQVRVLVSIVGSKVFSATAALNVMSDLTPPALLTASSDASFTSISARFSEFLGTSSAEDTFGYELTGPGMLSVVTATLQPDGITVILQLNGPMQVDSTYTLAATMVMDLAGNQIAPGAMVQIHTWKLAPGYLTFETYNTAGGEAVSILTSDPDFPNNPRATYYLNAFNTRLVYPDDSNEAYGGRIRGVFIPPTSGNWIFYLSSDDSSELYLNPTGPSSAGKILLTAETACCNGFASHASAPQALVAGQLYYIEALYKEGGGGDYCKVAAKLDTDPTDPNLLAPIAAGLLGTYVNPIGLSLTVTSNPSNRIAIVSTAAQTFGLEAFSSTNSKFYVLNGIEGGNVPAPTELWRYNSYGTWSAIGGDGIKNSALTSPDYFVTASGAISMTFLHRYNFEYDNPGTRWDGGILRLSINRGLYVTVPAASIAGNSYQTDAVIGGNCPPVRGQYAFNGQSPGFVTSNFVTSTAALGTFNAGDVISVQFLAAWDESYVPPPAPGWEITSVSFSPSVENSSADGAVTFTASAVASVNGSSVIPYYQWQRNSGAGYMDVNYATSSSYTFVPSTHDDGVMFRCLIGAPATNVLTAPATLYVVPRQTITRSLSNAIIAWPAPSANYTLERTSILSTPASTVWAPVGITPTVVNGMNTVSIPATTGQSFFRIKRN
ncbi:MAG: hypothetical protein QOF48_1092 [Verrucomicrobiota bacterium]